MNSNSEFDKYCRALSVLRNGLVVSRAELLVQVQKLLRDRGALNKSAMHSTLKTYLTLMEENNWPIRDDRDVLLVLSRMTTELLVVLRTSLRIDIATIKEVRGIE